MPPASIVCYTYLLTLLTNVIIEANIVNPDQTAPKRAVSSGFTLFVEEAPKIIQHATKQMSFVVIGTLRVKQ